MRKSFTVMFALAFLATSVACASARQNAAQGGTTSSSAAPAQEQKQEQAKQEPAKDEKKKKKDKKKDAGGTDVIDTSAFSAAEANDILGQIRDGLEGRMQRRLLGAFDQDKMSGYLQFEDQIERLFAQYDSFRVNFRILQTTIEGPKGIVLVDAEMEEVPRAGGTPVRKRTQLRLELERGRKGWKIVDFAPRAFFS